MNMKYKKILTAFTIFSIIVLEDGVKYPFSNFPSIEDCVKDGSETTEKGSDL